DLDITGSALDDDRSDRTAAPRIARDRTVGAEIFGGDQLPAPLNRFLAARRRSHRASRRDAVHRFQRIELRTHRPLAVLLEIDEAGSDDEPGCVDGGATLEAFRRDRADDAADDADVPHAVETRFGIDDAAVRDDEVVDAGRLERRRVQRADATDGGKPEANDRLHNNRLIQRRYAV